jgi:cathepsin E
MSPSTMLALVLAACAMAVGATLPKIPFTAHTGGSLTNGLADVPAADRARIAHIHTQAQAEQYINASRAAHTINATNAAVTYTVNVTVGGVARDLLVDTGSSNTWIGARTPYNTSACDGFVFVAYGSGLVLGYEVCRPIAPSIYQL